MPPTSRLTTGLAAALAASTLGVVAINGIAISPASAAVTPSVLPSIIPAWAAKAPVVGATPADQTVYVLLTLAGQDPAGMQSYATAASTPGNPLYRQWLTQSEFAARFAPLPAHVTEVTDALGALGLTKLTVDKLGLTVLATMTAAQASTVFGVSFHQVTHDGQSVRVATNQLVLPSALTGLVSEVSGLSQELDHDDMDTGVPGVTVPPVSVPPVGGVTSDAPPGFYNAQPASTYYASKLATDQPMYPVLSGDSSTTKPYNTIGYTPAQIRGAYGVDKVSETGVGAAIGIVDAFDGPKVASDLTTFSSQQGLAAPTYTDLSPDLQGETETMGNDLLDPLGWEGEQTLDVEAVHLMAPAAAIVYSGATAPEDGPFEQAIVAAAANGAEQVSNSYGGSGDTDQADETALDSLAEQLQTMGVGLDFSTGDDADNVAANGTREIDFPAASPEVTGVGGTGLEVGSSNNYQGEFYWGTLTVTKNAAGTAWDPTTAAADGGGGGGVSSLNAEPSYQVGVVPAAETENADTGTGVGETTGVGVTTPGRVLPDVAMLADPATGMLVGETQVPDAGPNSGTDTYSYYRIGGTSVSSPLFTGMLALADQAAGKSVGWVNPTIYPLENKGDGAFRDPQVGRVPTSSKRLAGTVAAPNNTPVVAEVRSDYADTSDPLTTQTVTETLRLQGVLSTLDDLPGYDDSTGLGTPDAPQFIADLAGTTVTGPPPATPEAPLPIALVVVGAAAVGGIVRRRRRSQPAADTI